MKMCHVFWLLSAIYISPHITESTSMVFAGIASIAAVVALVTETRDKQ
jgi:hypothetical protein